MLSNVHSSWNGISSRIFSIVICYVRNVFQLIFLIDLSNVAVNWIDVFAIDDISHIMWNIWPSRISSRTGWEFEWVLIARELHLESSNQWLIMIISRARHWTTREKIQSISLFSNFRRVFFRLPHWRIKVVLICETTDKIILSYVWLIVYDGTRLI